MRDATAKGEPAAQRSLPSASIAASYSLGFLGVQDKALERTAPVPPLSACRVLFNRRFPSEPQDA